MTRTRAFKQLLLPVLVAITAACSPVMKGVSDGLILATGIGQKPIEERAINPNFGYLKVSSGPEALFVLGYREQGREAWFGAGPMTLTIENGVVVASAGIGDDLALHQMSGIGADYFDTGLHTLPKNEAVRLQRVRSVRGNAPDDVQLHSQSYELIAVGEEQVKVWAGERINLLRVEERPLQSKAKIQWPGAIYWVSPTTGDVVASEQWLTPKRRFALVPREAISRLEKINYEQSLQPVVVAEPTRLSSVLRSDARWARQSVVAIESKAKQRQAKRLQQGLLIDLREAAVNANTPKQRQLLQRLHGLVQALSVSGRWTVPILDAYWLDASPGKNPMLAAGDRVVPVSNPSVTVITPDGEICRQAHVPQHAIETYLVACGVKKVSHGVLVNSLGQASTLALGLWNRQPTPAVGPGSVIAIPVSGLPLSHAEALAQLWWMESLP